METDLTMQEVFVSSFQTVLEKVINFLPILFAALVVLAIGWIIAIALNHLVVRVLNFLKIDSLLEKGNVKKPLEKTEVRLNVAKLCGALVKWFVIIVAFLTAADILNLPQATEFLTSILLYLPNVIVAVIILIIGILLANFSERVIKGSVKVARLVSAEILGAISKWAILLFSIIAALIQLKVAPELLQIFFTGLVAMIVIAGGLAFGLGGKDEARRILENIRKRFFGGE